MHNESKNELLLTRRQKFYPMFNAGATNLTMAAALLKEALSGSEQDIPEAIFRQISEIEHNGDEITRNIVEKLNKTIVTPIDRKDIFQLASDIDEVVDVIKGICHRIYIHKAERYNVCWKKLADKIDEAAQIIDKIIHMISDPSANKEKINQLCMKVKVIEHEGDLIYATGIAVLFETESDFRELISTNRILEMLERCLDAEEDISDTVRSIMVKTL